MATPFPKWKVRSSSKSAVAASSRLQYDFNSRNRKMLQSRPFDPPRRSISIWPCSAASGAKSWLFPQCLGCQLAPLYAPHSAWQCPCSLHFSSPSEPPRFLSLPLLYRPFPVLSLVWLVLCSYCRYLAVVILRVSLLCNPFQLFFCDSACYP